MQACVTKFFKPLDPSKTDQYHDWLFQKEEADRKRKEEERIARIKEERAKLRQRQKEIEKKRKLTLQKKREEEAKRREEIAKKKLEGQLVIPQLYLGTRLCAQNWEWLHEAQNNHRLYYILNVTNNVPNYYETGLKPSDLEDIQEDLLELQNQFSKFSSNDDQEEVILKDQTDKESNDEESKNDELNEDININDWNEEDLFEKLEHLNDEKKLEILEKFKIEDDNEEEDMDVEENNDETDIPKAEDVIEQTKNKLLTIHEGELKFVYKRIPIEDSYDEDISKYFDEGIEFIKNAIDKGDSVLVHCREGRSRSVAMIISYLIVAKNWTLQAANDHMATIALDININNGFKAKLMELEMKVHSVSTLDYFDKSTRVQSRVQYNEDSLQNIERRTRSRNKKSKKKVELSQTTTNEKQNPLCKEEIVQIEEKQTHDLSVSNDMLDDEIIVEDDIHNNDDKIDRSESLPQNTSNNDADIPNIVNEPTVNNINVESSSDQPVKVENKEANKLLQPKKKPAKKLTNVNSKTKQFWESFLLKTN